MFRVYELGLTLNEKYFREIWIDPHYEVKHAASINDHLILELLLQLNNEMIDYATESYGFRYYEVDVELRRKTYRMILVIPMDGGYLGVRNTYRRSK